MKKNSMILVFVAILALVVTSCNLQVAPSNGPQPGQPQPGQPQPGQSQPGQPQPGQPQPGQPQPGQPQPGQPQPGQPQPGQPQPGQPPTPEQPPAPTQASGSSGSSGSSSSGSGCAGAPVIPYFTANPTSITSGQSSTLSWGNVTNGKTGPMVGSTTIEPGLGEVGSGASSRTVKPTTTTTYTLTGTGCGGTTSKQVTVTVKSSGGFLLPLTPLIAVPLVLDMTIVNIFARSGDGHIMFTVKNSGTATFTSGGFTYSCSGSYVDSSGATKTLGPTSGGIPAWGGILKDPGDWANYDTGFVLTSSMSKTRVKCVLDESGWTSANSANNTLSSKLN